MTLAVAVHVFPSAVNDAVTVVAPAATAVTTPATMLAFAPSCTDHASCGSGVTRAPAALVATGSSGAVPPVASVTVAGLSANAAMALLLVGGGGGAAARIATPKLAVFVMPPTVTEAVMVAAPALRPRTTPAASTVATVASLEVNCGWMPRHRLPRAVARLDGEDHGVAHRHRALGVRQRHRAQRGVALRRRR